MSKNTRPRKLLQSLKRRRRLIISTVVILLLIVVLIPQTETLWNSLEIVRGASPLLVGVALGLTFLTYALSAEIYHLLIKHSIPLHSVFIVQLAAALTSRIAPIGIGTMGLNAVFLKRQRHTLPESLAVVAVNNGIGISGHLMLLAIVATTAPFPSDPGIHLSWQMAYWLLLAVALVVIVFAASERLRTNALGGARSLLAAVGGYRKRQRQLLLALITSFVLSTVYVLALLSCSQALGITLPFNQVFMIYTFSIITGLLTATPGGLVGVEAGLVTGFVAYGVSSETALAIALLYRLLTYWLPLLPGFIAFRVVQHRYF